MKFYLLTRKDNQDDPTHDVSNGFLVVARNSEEARLVANQKRGDERPDAWLNILYSDCMELDESNYEGFSQILLRDFNAG